MIFVAVRSIRLATATRSTSVTATVTANGKLTLIWENTKMPNPYPYQPTIYPYPNQPWDLDVRDWGAKGDGATDDTLAIQAALDAADSYGGGIVFLSPGTYLISATVKLPSKVYIK